MLILIICSFALSIFSSTCIQVLKSERKATERYRNKINKIRGIYLKDSSDEKIQEYIDEKSSKEYSVRLISVPIKELRFMDVFNSDKRCTSLYIKVFMDCGLYFALIIFIISIIILLLTFI